MGFISFILNFSLVGASGFAAFVIKLEHPYAFAACAFTCIHSLLSIIHAMKGAEESKVKEISDLLMDILPLSFINIELYTESESGKAVAKAHWFFIIPLTFELIARLFTEEGEDSSVKALKDLTIFGNVVSLSYIAFTEQKSVLAILMLLSRYGSFLVDYIKEGAGSALAIIFESAFYLLLALAIVGGGEDLLIEPLL